MTIFFCNHKNHFCNIGMCHRGKYYRPDKKKIMVSSLWPTSAMYLEDPFGSDRWSNSTIRLTQIKDGGPT
jgi:hypothetical protein